jgi:hypothetical protein
MKTQQIILIANLLLISHFASPQGFLKTDGQQIVNAKGEKVILRGIGLGGWMLQEGYMLRVHGIGQQQHVIRGKIEELVGKEKTDAFYNAWLANHTRKIDIDSLAAWGFNSVRLPMHYNLYTLSVDQEPVANENTWIEKGFALTDSLLKWCAANNLYLILDLHATPGGQGNDLNISDRDPSKPFLWQNEANQKKMIALWSKLAERYANNPWVGAYDIINEPNYGFEKTDDKNGCSESSNIPLKKLMTDITNTIRKVDKNHIIIIEGNCWGNNYNGVFPPWDANTVISFHKYWNYNDQASIQKFIDIRKQYNAPVWLGESGENSNLWFRDAIHLMEQNEIGWAWWPLKKLGFNNPLEVKVPTSFQKILTFWDGKGDKPSVTEAYNGLMELCSNLKLENCIYHKDVIDAMFRQTRSNTSIPFKRHIAKAGESILAVDYDLGRNRFAYFDNDTANYWVANGKHSDGNQGRTYRNDGVDISKQGDHIFVDHFEPGEWLQYTVTASEAKTLNVSFSLSTKVDGKILAEFNGNQVEMHVPESKNWMATFKKVHFKSGLNVIRIKVLTGELNFQSIHFE